MNTDYLPNPELEQRVSSRLLDVLIRAGLVLALVLLCYEIFAPFVSLLVWALIIAVTLYPLHQHAARALGGRQGLASTLIVIVATLVLVVPIGVLMGSLGDSVQDLAHSVQENRIAVPPPYPGVEDWPLVGKKIHAVWSQAHADLPALVAKMQPEVGNLVKSVLESVASIGGALLKFFASFVVAGIIMSYGAEGHRSSWAIFRRIAGHRRGGEFVALSTSTVRAVAQGVIGIAFVQAIILGLALLVAGVPWAGALALLLLALGIAQIPAAVVTLPAIAYVWMSGGHPTGIAIAYTVLLIVAGMADNVLKPLLLGRGVDAPMPVILLGALGGMAAAGILGMFVGAVLLALGYQIFMHWVKHDPDAQAEPEAGGD